MSNPVSLIVVLALIIPILAAMAIMAFVQAAITDKAVKDDIKRREEKLKRIEVTIRRLK